MYFCKLLIAVIIGLLIPTSSFADGDLKARIEALVEQTKKNMVFVQGGSFMMGDPGVDVIAENGKVQHLPLTMYTNDDFVHKVTLDSFWIGKFEVTYAEYDVFTEATGRPKHRKGMDHSREPDHPSGTPNWYDAKAYCLWLSKQTGLPFDLPSEAQWEYSARSRGRDVRYATDNGSVDWGRNIQVKSDNKLKAVGSFPPNPLGIYDMVGGVSEWVSDWYDEKYYKKSPRANPKGPDVGKLKVYRGCNPGWSSPAATYERMPEAPGTYGAHLLGMRCVCNAQGIGK